MTLLSLTPFQYEIIRKPVESKIFLEGQAGSGKTTVGVQRMLALLQAGIPANEILLMVPQRTLGAPYQDALKVPDLIPGGQVTILTMGGLARRMVDLFWPLVAQDAGFARPNHPPSFLTLETSLYYMAYLVRPLLDEGLFDSVTIDRNRIYSQILDNLNKAAIVGFPYTDIGKRLRSAWIESTEQGNVFEDAQHCATLFREYCLQNNLLDFSLQIEIFRDLLWPNQQCQDYLKNTYHHLIADNLEEDNPVAHDLLLDWLPDFDSALLIYDQDAGYRRFLGADPVTALSLIDLCQEHHIFSGSFVCSPELNLFCQQLAVALDRPSFEHIEPITADQIDAAVEVPTDNIRFYPQMLDWVVDRVARLIEDGTPPSEIVILAPLLPDSLRFALINRLEARRIPYRSHRPSRSLRDEPAVQALLTLASLAYPEWGILPSSFEVAYTLIQAIEGLDLVRAQLLVEAVYRPHAHPSLLSFNQVKNDIQERITFTLGDKYETLRLWIEAYQADPSPELDYFFSRLFGEVLSQPGYGFHANYDAGQACASLIESAQKFRWAVEDRLPPPEDPETEESPLGKEYINMIQEGILAAQYLQSWQIPADNAVLLAPAYTFLLTNQPVEHQFWLDIGSQAWFERLSQPLTHPVILTRQWKQDHVWTDIEEYEYNRETLYCLALGLIRRCRKQIHLAYSDLNEGGYESLGMLMRAINQVKRQSKEARP